jgi:hypothetical protein
MDYETALKIIEKNKKKINRDKIIIEDNKTNLKNKTLESYIKKVKYIHKKILNEDIDNNLVINLLTKKHNYNLSYLNNNILIDYLNSKYTNKNTIKSYLIPFNIISNNSNSNTNFTDIINKINKDYEKQIDDNIVNLKDKNKIILDYNIKTLENNIDSLEDIEDKLIYALYTLIPPRRLEYSNMYIINDTKQDNDNSKNYLLVNETNNKFIFNNYKTNRTFKKQIIDITNDTLKNIIKNYLKTIDSDKLFNYSSNNFGKKISSIFKEIYNEDITVRWLRISYTTYIRKENKSNNELKDISYKMAHSIQTNSRYNKIKMS